MPSKQQLKGYKNRLSNILHNMKMQDELHSGPALDLHNDLAGLRSIGIKTDIPNVPPLNLDSIYRQNSRCKVGSKEFKLTIILIGETIKNIDTQINNMQSEMVKIKLGQDNRAHVTGKTPLTFQNSSTDSERNSTSSGSGTSSDSPQTIPKEVAVSYSTNQPQQKQNLSEQRFASIRRSGRRVSTPKVPNCTTNSSVLSTAESSQTGNTPIEKSKNNLPKSIFTGLLKLFHLSNNHTR